MNIETRQARYQVSRPSGVPIDLIVIHATAGRWAGDLATLLGKTGRVVSAHSLIGKDGYIVQLVPDEREAWHAGQSSWPGFPSRFGSLNARSIGVELSNLNNGKDPYPEAQLEACAEWVRERCRKWDIPMNRKHIVGHWEISPGRKTDPRGLDLDDLVRRINRWVAPKPKGWVVEVTAQDGLNIRQGAKDTYPKAGKLAFGERVVIDAVKDEGQGAWLHLADQRGFISPSYTRRV